MNVPFFGERHVRWANHDRSRDGSIACPVLQGLKSQFTVSVAGRAKNLADFGAYHSAFVPACLRALDPYDPRSNSAIIR